MESRNSARNIIHVVACKCVGNNALVCRMGHAVRSTVGAQRAARTGSEDAIVPRVNVEADSALVLQLAVNVIQMSVEIAGLAVEMAH